MTTPTVTAPQIVELVLDTVEALTPDSAPIVLFVRHSDRATALENVTDPGRLRLLEVRLEAPRIGTLAAAPGSSKTNFNAVLAVSIGYSLEVWETLDDDVEYLIRDLIDSDLEQIRRALDSSSTFTSLPGFKLQRFEGAQLEASGKKNVIRYSVSYGRAY